MARRRKEIFTNVSYRIPPDLDGIIGDMADKQQVSINTMAIQLLKMGVQCLQSSHQCPEEAHNEYASV